MAFKKGEGGRPAGARNKLQAKFTEQLAKDFEEHGEGVINIVRMEKPDVYLKIIASVLPKEFQIGDSAVAALTDDEVTEALAMIKRMRASKVPDAA